MHRDSCKSQDLTQKVGSIRPWGRISLSSWPYWFLPDFCPKNKKWDIRATKVTSLREVTSDQLNSDFFPTISRFTDQTRMTNACEPIPPGRLEQLEFALAFTAPPPDGCYGRALETDAEMRSHFPRSIDIISQSDRAPPPKRSIPMISCEKRVVIGISTLVKAPLALFSSIMHFLRQRR
jgi:hypothetical protein